MKKLQVLAICMVILMSFIVTSCGSGVSNESKGLESTAGTGENATSQATEPAAPDELRILSYFSAEYNNYSKESKYTDWPVLKEIEKKTNTKIIWEMYAGDVYATTVQTILASGSGLPDIIWNVEEADNLLLNDVTIDLAPYIKGGKAPNLLKLFNDYPEAASFNSMDDGRIAAVPHYIDAVKDNVYSIGMKKEWLDKAQLQIPSTIDEFNNILIAFRDKDPNGNEKKDEIPFMTRRFDWFRYFGPSFGIKSNNDDWYFYADDKNKVYCTVATPEYKNYITWINMLYNEKLVNRSALETPDAVGDIVAAMKDKTVGSILWNSYNVLPGWNEAYSNGFVNVLPPKGPGVAKVEASARSAASGSMVVTKASKNPDAAVRYIDFNYSEEGITLSGYGIENDSYKIVDGKKIMTDKLKTNTTGNPDWYMPEGYGIKTHMTVYEWDPWGQMVGWTETSYKDNAAIASLFTAKPFFWKNFRIINSERVIRDNMWTDVKTFIEENLLKFATGIRPLSEWDAFTTELADKYKVGEIIEGYIQPAYDRYLKDIENLKK